MFYGASVLKHFIFSDTFFPDTFFAKHLRATTFALHKKSFPLRISLVNVTKSEENCVLVTFTEEILHWELQYWEVLGKKYFQRPVKKMKS